ncbi:MAG: ABC transporter ATP-binding protein [Thermoleophilia bacterium]
MIEVKDAVKQYGATRAADGVSFVAPAGKVTALLGPNGAGKTTTMRILLGLARPESGTALIDGRRYEELEDPRRTVGAALDSMGFHPGRTGRNHLRVVARAAGIDPSRVDEVLEVVGLTADGGRRAGGYSRGMQQRLALAGALLGDPTVLILDEPNIGLDPAGIAWFRETMRGWAAEGRTVLVSSHVLTEVALVADRVVIINRGRVLREANTGDLGGHASAVIVRSPDTVRLEELCRAEGWRVERVEEESDRLTIHGASAEQVGQTAAGTGIVVHELTTEAGTAQLEQMFLELTGSGEEALS